MKRLVFIFVGLVVCVDRVWPAEEPPAKEPLSLRDSVRLALENDHDVLKASRALDAAHARLSSARAQFFPKAELGISAGTYHDRIPQPGDKIVPLVSRDRNAYVAQVLVSQPIFSGFQKTSSLQRYGAEERTADLGLELAKEKAIEETIGLYFRVQLYENQILAEKEIQAFREKQLKEVENRLRHGAATDLQQLQALYAVKQQIPKIQDLEAQLSLQFLQLYRRLNLPLDSHRKLTDPLPNNGSVIPFKLPPLAEAFDFALKNSLRVRQLEAQREAVQAQSGEALAVHLPSVSLDLNAGTRAFQRYDIATSNSLAYGAQLNLTIPLFSGLDSFSDREMWHARLDEIKEERAKLRETLLNDLNDTYRRLEMSTNRIEASRVNLELAERTVRKAEQSYRVGAVTLPEVLGAYSASLEAKKQTIQDTYDRILALFHIKSLLGLGAKFDAG